MQTFKRVARGRLFYLKGTGTFTTANKSDHAISFSVWPLTITFDVCSCDEGPVTSYTPMHGYGKEDFLIIIAAPCACELARHPQYHYYRRLPYSTQSVDLSVRYETIG